MDRLVVVERTPSVQTLREASAVNVSQGFLETLSNNASVRESTSFTHIFEIIVSTNQGKVCKFCLLEKPLDQRHIFRQKVGQSFLLSAIFLHKPIKTKEKLINFINLRTLK